MVFCLKLSPINISLTASFAIEMPHSHQEARYISYYATQSPRS